MAEPKSDIFSTFVFNNIMALSLEFSPPFFRRPTRHGAINPFSSATCNFRNFPEFPVTTMCFHIHDGKHRNHFRVKAPISSRQKAPLLIQKGGALAPGVVTRRIPRRRLSARVFPSRRRARHAY